MAGFKFSLEAVLAYRESIVEMRQVELAKVERKVRQARAVRDGLVAEVKQSHADLQALFGQDGLSIEAVRRVEFYRQSLTERLKQQRAAVADLEAEASVKREELLKAQQDMEVLTELEARQFRRFVETLEETEARLIDESAITGFNRRGTAPVSTPARPTSDPEGLAARKEEDTDAD
ncbi:MAG: hypothetical protein MAG451_03166 [Anaerolineales bacterium]|nr:hypothetical protein [Anaerolineales bacterium]